MPSSPGHPHLASLPTELLLMITDHLPPRPLCSLSATCRAFYALLDHVCIARFTAAATTVLSGFVMCSHCSGCCRVPSGTSDYHQALDLLDQASARGCPGLVKRILELRGVPSDANEAERDGPSPLTRAMLGGHVETVRCLMEAGALVPSVPAGKNVLQGARAAAEMETLLVEYRDRACREKSCVNQVGGGGNDEVGLAQPL
ncbi:hypothetical protein DFP73DRAFT_546537 [Morchella snyderi]|nr:hypothetical protein DFP73DRAFT_546537 [Morchella snyderi]